MEEIKILDAVPEDAKGIIHVLYKAWLVTYPNKDIGLTVEDVEEKYKDAFAEERIKILQERIAKIPHNERRVVAKKGDMIIGVSRIIKNSDNNHLQTLYILPEFHHQGIGTRIWNELKKFFDPNKDVLVQVATYNTQAINFYKKLGFVDTGKRFADEKWIMKSGARIPEMEMLIKAGTTF